MEEIGKAMAEMGMENMAQTLSTAFANREVVVSGEMSGTVGMISQAISGKQPSAKTAVQQGTDMKGSFVEKMGEAGPKAIEMPEDISETGMMMGAMVMAKPSLAGGLPGAMAPPEGMTAEAMGNIIKGDTPSGEMMGDVMQNVGKAEMGEAMANMTGLEIGAMDKLGISDMAAQTGLTPGMVASMGAAGMAGMDITSVMSSNVAGLGSKAVKGIADMAKGGNMSNGLMGDMMEVGLVNQGTMAAMGAEGMNMGTRFMATKEAPCHERVKEAIINATELDTRLVMRPLRNTERVLNNSAVEKLLDKEKELGSNIKFEDIMDEVAGVYPKVMLDGEMEAGAWSCGMVVGLINDIPSCKKLIDGIMSEADSLITKRLEGMLSA